MPKILCILFLKIKYMKFKFLKGYNRSILSNRNISDKDIMDYFGIRGDELKQSIKSHRRSSKNKDRKKLKYKLIFPEFPSWMNNCIIHPKTTNLKGNASIKLQLTFDNCDVPSQIRSQCYEFIFPSLILFGYDINGHLKKYWILENVLTKFIDYNITGFSFCIDLNLSTNLVKEVDV